MSVGAGIGLMMLQAFAEMDRRSDFYGRPDSPREDAETALLLASATAIIAGGPVGAVDIGGVEVRRSDAYRSAVLGEILLGFAAYGLLRGVSDNQSVHGVGLGVGAVIGAASGAYLVTRQSRSSGLMTFRSGTWDLALPDLQVDPNLGADRAPEVGISLVSVRL